MQKRSLSHQLTAKMKK